MAKQSQPGNYTQGYSNHTLATHLSRTAESDAAFLLPHIKKTDNILDVGCGPGTITTGFTKYASEGRTVGIDISIEVLKKAKILAAEANIPTVGPGSIVFEEGNIVSGLAYSDDTFDIIYCGQVLGHFVLPTDLPLRALTEMRRVLKPGGILATRTTADQHFYPRSLDLDTLWVRNFDRALHKGATPAVDPVGSAMPALFRSVGFDANAGKVRVDAGTTVYSGLEARKWLAWRGTNQLQPGDAFYKSWIDAGITEEEIQQTLEAIAKWAETDDAWFAAMQCDVLGWK
jgi:ubiquinone/menaquinone biosynthesis C-methylase UbiE